ncbi:arylsulfatase [Pedobacter sp. BS3]|uniref:arylsulfatase n=1 Tax=Pedobacter sp. BS3 TaxID=2567937 RepID=UPI0011EBEB0B|nr:arylsulfatase [Pedobacter sp. BS3]TZF81150.1 arylsulfatase [Pedobacter sp. BS3]
MKYCKILSALAFLFIIATANAQQKRPNIILILSDDMGYSDIGCYGSEIETPNLDALANDGIRFTQFYNQARCCPSRASLMTGLYPHQTGIGWMDAVNHNLPGYQAQLNKNCVTIAQVLKSAGYSTYMAGKWHLQYEKDTRQDSPNYDWPIQRGFDKFYGILKGAGSYYDPGTLCRNNTLISPFNDPEYKPNNYYFTNAITDNAIKFIEDDKGKQPFFMYMAYTAAHWPMQAPEEAINKYKGRYDKGWDVIRRQRLDKMKRLGLIDSSVILPPLDTHTWEDEPDKAAMARRMETYAAMIDIMDQGIGRMVSELKKKGIFENTVILFMEDNGGNAEGLGYGGGPEGKTQPIAGKTEGLKALGKNETQSEGIPPITRDGKLVMAGKKVMAGPADTYLAYLKPWGQVSNTPFREYKHYVHEGGIATPLIAHWPAGIKSKGEFRNQIGNFIDIMPTIVDLAGARYPTEFNGNKITPVAGVSLVPAFYNKPINRKAIFWEHEMNRAVRMGDWKLVSTGQVMDGGYGLWKYYQKGPWELYNIKTDRAETRNLAGEYPDRVKEMAAMWEEWTKTVPVYPTPWQELKKPLRTEYIDPIQK